VRAPSVTSPAIEPSAPVETPAQSPSAEGQPNDDTAAAAQSDEAALQALMPKFDTMRIDSGGALTVAGRSTPNAVVDVIVSGQSLAKTTADSRGNFVALLDVPVTTDPRDVALTATDAAGLVAKSDQSLIIAPRSAEEVAAAQETAETVIVDVPAGGDVIPEEQALALAVAMAKSEAQEKAMEPVQAPQAAPALLLADAQGVRVVSATPTTELTIDTVSYGDLDEVLLAGRGGAEGLALRAYLNDGFAGETALTGPDWQMVLTGVAAGTYTLRVDALDAQGKVVSRAEIPFKRETAEILAQARAQQAEDATATDPAQIGTETVADATAARLSIITVQPGNTLWGIASGAYGDGVMYVRLFDANRGQIRNPDLIYPGQIFTIPD
jgi:nucleoid-associated protein YgaU